MDKLGTNNKFFNIYYTILVIGMIFFSGKEGFLSNPVRIVFMILTIIPVFYHKEYFSWVVEMFLAVSLVSFAPVFPTDQLYYFPVITALAIYVIASNNQIDIFSHKKKIIFLILGLLIITFLHIEIPNFVVPVIISLYLLYIVKDENDVRMLLIGLICASLILAIMYLIYRNQFVVDYGGSSVGLERAGWINPNVYGLFISAGAILAIGALLNQIPIQKNLYLNVIFLATTILGGIVLCLLASRGAFLSWIICTTLFVLFSKTKMIYRLIFVGCVICVAIVISRHGLLDLLSYRMQDETFNTGGGRTEIWKMKLDAFFDISPFSQIFGIGKNGCDELAQTISTHNDFITSIVAFGYIGSLLYLLFLFNPVFKTNKANRRTVYILFAFLLIEAFTQEPVFRGDLSFMCFYLCVFFISQLSEKYE